VAGVTIRLSDGAQTKTVQTNAQGNYAFDSNLLGSDYTVTASSPAYSFCPLSQTLNNLSSNQTVNFDATPITYSISGRVTTSDGTGVAGAAIALSGTQNGATVSDAAGNYVLNNLNPGGSYTITVSKNNYVLISPTQSFNNLSANQTANFTASQLTYTISGSIKNSDANGAGLSGITVGLSGSKTATTVTGANGFYFFTVQPEGSYTITPVRIPESLFNSFAPASQTVSNLGSNQMIDFATVPFANMPHVLEFDGSPQTVDYGEFWKEGQDLGHFFWEFWAMPGRGAEGRYLISDGYGGAHALLFGFGARGTDGRYNMTGNVWNGTSSTNFGSDEGPAPLEWGHLAVGWDGAYITTYYNGVPVGKAAFAGPRRTYGPFGGGGGLFIGGSDHQNLIGRIAQVRGYESNNPRETNAGDSPFLPQTIFAAPVVSSGGSFLTNFFRPVQSVPDLSSGYPAGTPHVGRLRGVALGISDGRSTYPLPQFVVDPTAPNASTVTGPAVPTVQVDTPQPIPSGAHVFDSFSRKNSTLAFDGKGGLGSTEGGSAGVQTWQYSGAPGSFGLLNGRAVYLANNYFDLTWVATGSGPADLDIRVERNPGAWGSGITTGLVFRVQDERNFFYAYTRGNGTVATELTIGYVKNGVDTNVSTGLSLPTDLPNWVRLRVVTLSSGSLKVYIEQLSDSRLIYTGVSPELSNAKGAGLFNWRNGQSLANRWDNFAVLAATP
jgi:hypothetical protein